jgi:hypothetical protein
MLFPVRPVFSIPQGDRELKRQLGGYLMLNKKRVLRVVAMTTVIAVPSFALWGIGDWVMDPTQWAYQMETTAQIMNEIKEVVQVKTNMLGMWNQVKQDAQFVQNKASWRGFFMSNPVFSPSNQNGETAGWLDAVNKGVGVTAAWSRSAEQLAANPSLKLGSHLAVDYANAEIGTSSTLSALQTLGTARAVQQQMQNPINNCEESVLSKDQSDNTIAASANISNACEALGLRQGQTALSVETARLDLEAQRAKREADELVAAANTQTADQQYRAKLSAGDVATSISTFKDR